MTFFWFVAQCNLVEINRRCRGGNCLHHQGDFCQTTQHKIPRRQSSSYQPLWEPEVSQKLGLLAQFCIVQLYFKPTNSVSPEPEGSSPYSQEPATGPYAEPARPTLHPLPANLPKIHSDDILPSTPRSSEWSFSSGLSHQYLVHFSLPPMRATCPAHLILSCLCLMVNRL
jgi:hypothetical protein